MGNGVSAIKGDLFEIKSFAFPQAYLPAPIGGIMVMKITEISPAPEPTFYWLSLQLSASSSFESLSYRGSQKSTLEGSHTARPQGIMPIAKLSLCAVASHPGSGLGSWGVSKCGAAGGLMGARAFELAPLWLLLTLPPPCDKVCGTERSPPG